MGFYGNITNTSRTQFQFDVIYPNRKTMDLQVSKDSVYIGRYALIEYDKQMTGDSIVTGYLGVDNRIYISYEGAAQAVENSTQATFENDLMLFSGAADEIYYIKIPKWKETTTESGQVIRLIYNLKDPTFESDLLFRVEGYYSYQSKTGEILKLPNTIQLNSSSGDTYSENYNIDIDTYGPGRGYDSTVWQKAYVDGQERYVMIAELNSVVPTFDIAVDGPTLSPIIPYFDKDSTNVYYKLHQQPNWGLRVRSAVSDIQVMKTLDNGDVDPSKEYVSMSDMLEKDLPSDETVRWTKSNYDKNTGLTSNYYYIQNTSGGSGDKSFSKGSWGTLTEYNKEFADIPAAIYYNKDGFDPKYISYSAENIKDRITVEPTGLSGNQYHKHKEKENEIAIGKEPMPDTQELSIMLPSIGDSVAQLWDIVYGDEEINNGKTRNTKIEWQNGSIVQNDGGLRLFEEANGGYGYNTSSINTLAGSINSVHDLMGMIIKEEDTLPNPDEVTKDYIYYVKDTNKYYRKYKDYEFFGPAVSDIHEDDYYNLVELTDWNKNSNNYYYIDINSKRPDKPNFILDKEYYQDRQYYQVGHPTERDRINFTGNFEPYKYFEQSIVNGAGKNTYRYTVSADKEYDSKKTYYSLTIGKMLGDDEKLIQVGKNTENYYEATFVEASTPTLEEFIKSKQYFIKQGNKYVRPVDYTEQYYVSNAIYATANLANDFLTIDDTKQYFMVNRGETTEEGLYVKQINYLRVNTALDAESFYDGAYYTYDSNRKVYLRAFDFETNVVYYTKQEKLILIENDTIPVSALNEVSLVGFVENKYYSYHFRGTKDGLDYYELINSNMLADEDLNNIYIIESTDIKEIDKFYTADNYYYQITDKNDEYYGSYVIDTNSKYTENRVYYTSINDYSSVDDLMPYEQGKYYQKVQYYPEGKFHYILDMSDSYQGNKAYYKKDGLYVEEDTSGIFPSGFEWNLNVSSAPKTVTLKKKKEVWRFKELIGFAKHLNTIHGLILKINEMLESGHLLNRETDNIQGLLNRLKDIMVYFGDLEPKALIFTDENGRFSSAEIIENDWIKTNVDYVNSTFSIEHNYIGELEKGTYSAQANQEPKFGETFTINSFDIDEKGHVIAHKEDAVTIKIPQLSLINGEGNISTGFELEAASGIITENKANVGNLSLTDYEGSTVLSELTEEKTINQAFKIIDTYLDKLDCLVESDGNNIITSISQTGGLIEALQTNLGDLKLAGYTGENNLINPGNTLNEALLNIENKLYSLNYAVEPEGNVVTNIFQTEGLIEAEKGYAANITLGQYREEDYLGINSNSTFRSSFEIISDKLNELNIALEELKNKELTQDDIPELSANKITSDILDIERIPVVNDKISFEAYSLPEEELESYEILTTDTLLAAIAKLETRIIKLENPQ